MLRNKIVRFTFTGMSAPVLPIHCHSCAGPSFRRIKHTGAIPAAGNSADAYIRITPIDISLPGPIFHRQGASIHDSAHRVFYALAEGGARRLDRKSRLSFFPVDEKIAKAHYRRKQNPGNRPYNPSGFPGVGPEAPTEIYGGSGQPIRC